eukprot:5820220-Pleurochrysis_carterae.AAC.1
MRACTCVRVRACARARACNCACACVHCLRTPLAYTACVHRMRMCAYTAYLGRVALQLAVDAADPSDEQQLRGLVHANDRAHQLTSLTRARLGPRAHSSLANG